MQGNMGGRVGQKAEGLVDPGNQVWGHPTRYLLGEGGGTGQVGSGYLSVEAK